MDTAESKVFVYPRMLSLHDMGSDAGEAALDAPDGPTAGPNKIRLPAAVNLSHERLTSEGVFLLENAVDLFMWIGRAVSPAIINTLFGVSSIENVDISLVRSGCMAAVMWCLAYMHMRVAKDSA